VVQTGSGTNIFGSPNPRHIFKVTDGTTAADKGDIYAGLENDTFVTVQADDSNKAWALAGYNGMYYLMPRNYILNSSDGGASWDVTSYGSAKNFHLSSISAYGNTVVAVGQYYVANAEPKCVDGPGGTTGGTRSVILRSLDGGKTWNEISWGPEESQFTYYYMLTSVHLVSENSGWVIGYYPCPDKSKGEKNWVYTGILLKYS
jgi:photosystem II stability/assembly factor-like uncharacterized protein